MHSELTNLLPSERLGSLKREYFIRLATVAVSSIAAVVLASSALLLPSYLFLHQEIQSRQARIADLDAQLIAVGGDSASKRLAVLYENATYLTRLATNTTATGALGAVLAVPHTSIALTGFSFAPPLTPGKGRMTLSGIASTREVLRAYVLALGALPFVTGVDLPISVYAKESSIPFVITLTGPFLP